MYTTNVIFHFTFDSTPIQDAVTGDFVTYTGTSPVIVDSIIDGGFQMRGSTYIELQDSMSFTNELTIGFWLIPVNPGIATNPQNNASAPLKMPIMSKAIFTVSNGVVSATNASFIVWEETQPNNSNVIKFQLIGNTTATLTSSPYIAGTPHHFWMAYDGQTLTFNLYVDTMQDMGSTINGPVPTSLNINASPFDVNNNVCGNTWQIARNNGIIDDLIIFSSTINSVDSIVDAANNGAVYVADSNYINIQEIDQGAVFDDPGTAQVNAVYSDKDKLYVARSDGKLLIGNKTLWESSKDFDNSQEENDLVFVSKSDSGYAQIIGGSLDIQDAIIRA